MALRSILNTEDDSIINRPIEKKQRECLFNYHNNHREKAQFAVGLSSEISRKFYSLR